MKAPLPRSLSPGFLAGGTSVELPSGQAGRGLTAGFPAGGFANTGADHVRDLGGAADLSDEALQDLGKMAFKDQLSMHRQHANRESAAQ